MIKPHFKTAVQAPYYTVYIHSATGMKIHLSCIVMVLVVRKTFLIVGCGSGSTVVSRGVWLPEVCGLYWNPITPHSQYNTHVHTP